MKHQRCIHLCRNGFDTGEIQFRREFISPMSCAYCNGKGVTACMLNKFQCLCRICVKSRRIMSGCFPYMSQFCFQCCAVTVGNVCHFFHFLQIIFICICGTVIHHRSKSQFQCLHTQVMSQTMVKMQHHRHRCPFCHRQEHICCFFQYSCIQQHFRCTNNDRALIFFCCLQNTFCHFQIHCIKKSNAIFPCSCRTQYIIQIC